MKHKPHLTAIGRKTLPLPTRWLLNNGRLTGKVLDFGCGRCHKVNNQHFKADGFDPHYEFDQTDTSTVTGTKYDTVICNYVICVLPPAEQKIALKMILSRLKPKGTAYISVRTDKPRQGWGMSSKGTYQAEIKSLPGEEIHKAKDYSIYLLTRDVNVDNVVTR